MKRNASCFIFGLFILVTGCATTSLVSLPLSEELKSLTPSTLAPEVSLDIHISSEVTNSLGTQFFLLVFPLGKTLAGEIEALTLDAAYKELLIAGYRPNLDLNKASDNALRVTVRKAEVTTYDLVFTRLVKCSVTLEMGWILKNTGKATPPFLVEFEQKSYIPLPFSRRLSKEFQKTVSKAVKRGIQLSPLAPRP